MKKKVWLVTKDEYYGYKRKLGYIQRNTNGSYDDLYYDFTMVNGSHDSYHRDGSEWRTHPVTKQKRRIKESTPLKFFDGLYCLGINLFHKWTVATLPSLKSKNIRNDIIYEVDIESFPSKNINIYVEILSDNIDIDLLFVNKNTCPPNDAETITIKDFKPWVIVTILGHNNLITDYADNGVQVNHFNDRFSMNRNGKQYEIEQIVSSKISWDENGIKLHY
jgi:hypothetical protein